MPEIEQDEDDDFEFMREIKPFRLYQIVTNDRNNPGPDLAFNGTIVAQVSSWMRDAPRWSELRLYKTEGGGWVCHSIGHTIDTEEEPIVRAEACKNEAEIKAFFGMRYLAKELYDRAGFDTFVNIP